jgi:hypothetical protein
MHTLSTKLDIIDQYHADGDPKHVFIFVPIKDANKTYSVGEIVEIWKKRGYLAGKDYLDYTSETTRNISKLIDINTERSRVKVVIGNASIAVGVSFAIPDKTYCFFAIYMPFNTSRLTGQGVWKSRRFVNSDTYLHAVYSAISSIKYPYSLC